MIPMAEIGWIAGFLEGEGNFTLVGPNRSTPRVSASQVDLGPIDRLHDRFGGNAQLIKREGNRSDIWVWYCPSSESVQIMMTIWSLVGTKRRKEIEGVLEGWKTARRVGRPKMDIDTTKLWEEWEEKNGG